jgi:hypothetical protein
LLIYPKNSFYFTLYYFVFIFFISINPHYNFLSYFDINFIYSFKNYYCYYFELIYQTNFSFHFCEYLIFLDEIYLKMLFFNVRYHLLIIFYFNYLALYLY